MAIVTGAIQNNSSIQAIGLCHSVQVCAHDLLQGLGMETDQVEYEIAGINHQAWLLGVIEAALTGRREHVYHAAMLDPHTAAELSLDDIRAMCDEMIEANRMWLPDLE